ncbi:hypothetical protein [Roseibium sp. MMSF_3544]|uniref:hypothetical protein n=1 Tax=unclassified Roseibium TaxID=2629323 RepID=UPI00273F66AF|nr:hypothetical protein [Roseibium sp. MMSF_3544]
MSDPSYWRGLSIDYHDRVGAGESRSRLCLAQILRAALRQQREVHQAIITKQAPKKSLIGSTMKNATLLSLHLLLSSTVVVSAQTTDDSLLEYQLGIFESAYWMCPLHNETELRNTVDELYKELASQFAFDLMSANYIIGRKIGMVEVGKSLRENQEEWNQKCVFVLKDVVNSLTRHR